jgi:protein-S-isoprenylcysteine O-methyltransferase Ste14
MRDKILSFLFGVLIFCGLPFVGWGVSDTSGLLANPFRLAYILLMTGLTFWAALFVPSQRAEPGRPEKIIRRQNIAILLLQLLTILILLMAPYGDRNQVGAFRENSFLRGTGLLFAFGGNILMNWAVLALKRNFSINVTVQEGHKLITTGLYRFVRHPRYLGILLFFSGSALVFRSWGALLANAMLLAVLLWRISDEEKLLEKEFSQEWREYCNRSYKLVPFVF